MHIIIAQMSHETNTYSPGISDLARFSPGAKVHLSPGRGTGDVSWHGQLMGGYLMVAEAQVLRLLYPGFCWRATIGGG
ncbi:MAG: hypothetical protein CM1200mP18_15850 [Gammaproteobacteria bacterium]|nr:MAG: hypothetical protein CM1200mP18_15850 [Gammaproteobacteria bacterium]